MAIPKPSEARLVVRHYEDGRMRVLLDGKRIPGVTGFEVSQQSGAYRSELKITIIGLAFRVEQADIKSRDDKSGIDVRMNDAEADEA